MAIIKPNNNTLSAITGLPAAIATGKVLQVVRGTSSTQFEQSSPTNGDVYHPSSNKISAIITPASTSSKIIINYIATTRINTSTGSDYGVALALKETISGGSTTTYKPFSEAYSAGFYSSASADSGNARVRLNEIVYSSASTTSQITYEVGIFAYNSNLIRLNTDGSRGDIIIYEVSG